MTTTFSACYRKDGEPKLRFVSEASAKKKLRDLLRGRRAVNQHRDDMQPYRCRGCGCWHLGNTDTDYAKDLG